MRFKPVRFYFHPSVVWASNFPNKRGKMILEYQFKCGHRLPSVEFVYDKKVCPDCLQSMPPYQAHKVAGLEAVRMRCDLCGTEYTRKLRGRPEIDNLCFSCLEERRRNHKKGAHLVKCKCPCCQRWHFKDIFWSGRGTPRFYCTQCSPNRSASIAFVESPIETVGSLFSRG